MSAVASAFELFFLLFFTVAYLSQLALNLLAIPALRRHIVVRALEDLPPVYPGFEPAVSVLLPAYNEEGTIVEDVRGLLALDYEEFEVVVVNDGSNDGTLAAMIEAFELEGFPEAHWRRLPARPVRTIYHSKRHANLRVVDKQHGGTADALNVGINASRHPVFCAIDPGSVLHRDALRRIVGPFLEDPATVASGGTVRVANGWTLDAGRVERVELPRHPLVLLQLVEHLRALLFGRLGWAVADAVLVPSGAFGAFRKDAVVDAGGYRANTFGEDMELVVRLHRLLRAKGQPYAIRFVPDPVCWKAAPETLRDLARERIRAQRGLAESLHRNLEISRQHGGGVPALLAFPFFVLFECYGPAIELAGYAFMAAMFLAGHLSGAAFLAFLAMAFALGFLVSVSALLVEEMSYRVYPRLRQTARLVATALLENLGYRQLVAAWRCAGLAQWLRSRL